MLIQGNEPAEVGQTGVKTSRFNVANCVKRVVWPVHRLFTGRTAFVWLAVGAWNAQVVGKLP